MDKPEWVQLTTSLTQKQINFLCKMLEHSVFLDSGNASPAARYDIFSAEPINILQLDCITDKTEILSKIKFFESSHLNKIKLEEPDDKIKKLPFTNGLLGFLSYDIGEALQLKSIILNSNNTSESISRNNFPYAFIGHYTWSYILDKQTSSGYLTFSPLCNLELRNKVLDLISASELDTAKNTLCSLDKLEWIKSQSFEKYSSQFTNIETYIKGGDCYQVNLTQRFEANSDISAADLYFETQKKIQTPYSCFISFSKHKHLLSFSPEQFIAIKDRQITTKPIKGTIANNGSQQNISKLKESKKNQAENIMIVDLLRNDLGKVCESNSIHVPELFKIETFNNVHHLVSQINGTLKNNITVLDAFISCFPGGSITGAPKVRAMEIIAELEKYPREAYCGSVFYLNHNGDFDSNILIRSVIKNENKLYCWAGGGIVADSELNDEYQESLTKVDNITGLKK